MCKLLYFLSKMIENLLLYRNIKKPYKNKTKSLITELNLKAGAASTDLYAFFNCFAVALSSRG